MNDKLMNIPNDNTHNYPFCRLQFVVETLNTQFNEQANENFIIVLKVVDPTNKKTLS